MIMTPAQDVNREITVQCRSQPHQLANRRNDRCRRFSLYHALESL